MKLGPREQQQCFVYEREMMRRKDIIIDNVLHKVVRSWHHDDFCYDVQVEKGLLMDIRHSKQHRQMSQLQYELSHGKEMRDSDVIDGKDIIGVDGYLELENGNMVPVQIKHHRRPVGPGCLGSLFCYATYRNATFPELAHIKPLVISSSGFTAMTERMTSLMKFDVLTVPEQLDVPTDISEKQTSEDNSDFQNSRHQRPNQKECFAKYLNRNLDAWFLDGSSVGTGKTTSMGIVLEHHVQRHNSCIAVICSPTRVLAAQNQIRLTGMLNDCGVKIEDSILFDCDGGMDLFRFENMKAFQGVLLVFTTYKSCGLLASVVNRESDIMLFDEGKFHFASMMDLLYLSKNCFDLYCLQHIISVIRQKH